MKEEPHYTCAGVVSVVTVALMVGLLVGMAAGAREGHEPNLFGIKPGELMLAVATFLLWWATYQLFQANAELCLRL
jgi:hypothetical protein